MWHSQFIWFVFDWDVAMLWPTCSPDLVKRTGRPKCHDYFHSARYMGQIKMIQILGWARSGPQQFCYLGRFHFSLLIIMKVTIWLMLCIPCESKAYTKKKNKKWAVVHKALCACVPSTRSWDGLLYSWLQVIPSISCSMFVSLSSFLSPGHLSLNLPFSLSTFNSV